MERSFLYIVLNALAQVPDNKHKGEGNCMIEHNTTLIRNKRDGESEKLVNLLGVGCVRWRILEEAK